jgi:hypothetical protein
MMELPQVPAPRCIHLQSKAMAVHGEGFEADADFQDGLTDFWCGKSARAIGPDHAEVNLKACSEPDRGCYEEY